MSGKNRFDRFPIVSSWGDGFYNFDFSCVVEQLKHSIIPPQAGRVVFAVPRNLYPGGFIFNGACFVLRDETGGFWLRATLGRKEWEGHDKLESSMVNWVDVSCSPDGRGCRWTLVDGILRQGVNRSRKEVGKWSIWSNEIRLRDSEGDISEGMVLPSHWNSAQEPQTPSVYCNWCEISLDI